MDIKPIDILLIEDNPGDIRLTQEALKEGKLLNQLFIARDGVEAMQFLHAEMQSSGRDKPDLILLDLNLPRKNGFEVLQEIKSDPDLRRIPVVVLTTSKAEEDILQSYDLHANCFITKPVNMGQFMQIVGNIRHFWISIVQLSSN